MDLEKVNRVEVIDHTHYSNGVKGRAYTFRKDGVRVEAMLQDDDRTLKIFISEKFIDDGEQK